MTFGEGKILLPKKSNPSQLWKKMLCDRSVMPQVVPVASWSTRPVKNPGDPKSTFSIGG